MGKGKRIRKERADGKRKKDSEIEKIPLGYMLNPANGRMKKRTQKERLRKSHRSLDRHTLAKMQGMGTLFNVVGNKLQDI